LPKGDSAWLLRKAIERIIQQISVLETNIGSSTTGNSANTQIIFNDAGTLRGDAGLTYNKTTDLLSVGAATITGNLTVNGSYIACGSNSYIRTDAANLFSIQTGSLGFRVMNAGNSALFYGIDSASTSTWYDGAGGTRMTLNSTGLAVGTTAQYARFTATGSNSTGIANIQNSPFASNANTNLSCYIGHDGTANRPFIQAATGNAGSAFDLLIQPYGGNVGVGVTPSAWQSTIYKVLEFSRGVSLSGQTDAASMELTCNAYIDSAFSWIYKTTAAATHYRQFNGAHQWHNAPSGTAGNAITFTQAMTLDASGNLLVGKTAGYGSGEANTLQLKSFLVFGPDDTGSASNRNWINGANGSAAGSLDWVISSANNNWPNFAYRMQLTSAGALNNTTGTYGTISDLRLKENISDARNYLADLLKLRVVKYSLKEESSAVATKLGFIAQEVEQVFPNLVEKSDKEYEGGEGIRTVKTTVLIPMLLKAIQELTARVEALEA
jgi:hypothetical protein